jgi:hypothetical protein
MLLLWERAGRQLHQLTHVVVCLEAIRLLVRVAILQLAEVALSTLNYHFLAVQEAEGKMVERVALVTQVVILQWKVLLAVLVAGLEILMVAVVAEAQAPLVLMEPILLVEMVALVQQTQLVVHQ